MIHKRFTPDPADTDAAANIRRAAASVLDKPVSDIARLRLDNATRLSAPAIRRPTDVAAVTSASFGTVEGEWIVPSGSMNNLVLLYCHGGAYVRGSLLQGRAIAGYLAQGIGGRAASIAWAQAPERTFPAPITDVIAAYEALLASGISPDSIIFAGDSAGGAVVVSAMLTARASAMPMPLACVSISPAADLSLEGETWAKNLDRDIVGRNFARSAIELYLDGTDPRNPLASPIFADLSGIPPMLVVCGEDEVLLSDALSLASCAERDGVEVELHTYSDMMHVFPMFNLRTGEQALNRVADFVRRQTSK